MHYGPVIIGRLFSSSGVGSSNSSSSSGPNPNPTDPSQSELSSYSYPKSVILANTVIADGRIKGGRSPMGFHQIATSRRNPYRAICRASVPTGLIQGGNPAANMALSLTVWEQWRGGGAKTTGGYRKLDEFIERAAREFGLRKTFPGDGTYGEELAQCLGILPSIERDVLWREKVRFRTTRRIDRNARLEVWRV